MPKKAGRPEERGTPPIRGQMRWHDEEWAEVMQAVEASGKTYAENVRPLILAWARRENKKRPRPPKL